MHAKGIDRAQAEFDQRADAHAGGGARRRAAARRRLRRASPDSARCWSSIRAARRPTCIRSASGEPSVAGVIPQGLPEPRMRSARSRATSACATTPRPSSKPSASMRSPPMRGSRRRACDALLDEIAARRRASAAHSRTRSRSTRRWSALRSGMAVTRHCGTVRDRLHRARVRSRAARQGPRPRATR